MIRDFIELLDILYQNPEASVAAVMGQALDGAAQTAVPSNPTIPANPAASASTAVSATTASPAAQGGPRQDIFEFTL